MKVFVFDSAKCNGCYGCQLACKDEHWNNEWLPYALPQPDTGHFWCKMTQVDHGQVPKVRVEYKPLFCNHCDDAPCIKADPEVSFKRSDGLVIMDPVKAKGRRDLVDSCPYGAIYWNEELPHCVDVCATGALRFGEEEEFAEELAQAETVAKAEHGPRVYYLNLPHLFIGGEVWDPALDEIIEGAKITLSGDARAVTNSDEFGDFWFRKLDPGDYTLTIEAPGFVSQVVDVKLEKSLNVGDFPLEREAGNEVRAPKGTEAAIGRQAPIDTPDVQVDELGDVKASMSVMSQAGDDAIFDDSGITSK